MAYKISDECISCGACSAECPTDSISEGADKYEIDGESCIDCGACAEVCPTDAISAG
ncbi:MAG TPA: ferredoxin [Clostridiales bacterium]|nr:ferredoxin [Clostridiales bacterium]